MIGHVIENYKIQAKIGVGGMGAVFKGQDLLLQREVAVKIVHGHLAHSQNREDRSHKEALALGKLNHPNIACLYNLIKHEDTWLIIMEFIAGESLQSLLSRVGAVSLQTALPLFFQMLDGMEHAHTRGIIHRDIKPANILVNECDQIKIVDFGLARIQDMNLTRTNTTMGTVAYMSPEQAQGEPLDPRTDIWSLGVVLYEMLTGRKPFQGSNAHALFYSIVSKTPVPLSSVSSHPVASRIPDSIAQVVMRALEKDPAQRFQTVAEFREALLVASRDLTVTGPLLQHPKSASEARAVGEVGIHTSSATVCYEAQASTLVAPLFPSDVTSNIHARWWKPALLGGVLVLLVLALTTNVKPDMAHRSEANPVRVATLENVVMTLDTLSGPSSAAASTGYPAQTSVERLLARAEQNINDLQLLTPARDNARANCDSVLLLDPDNQRAFGYLQRMADIYEHWADDVMQQGQPDQAIAFFKKGLSVITGRHERFSAYLDRVSRKMKQAEAMRFGSAAVASSSEPSPLLPSKTIFLTRGTSIPIRLVETLDAEQSYEPGSAIQFEVSDDVEVTGSVLIKKGAPVTASVSRSKEGRRGYVYFAITAVETMEGRSVAVYTEMEPGIRWSAQKRTLMEGAGFSVLVSKTTPVKVSS